ncbi:b(0,+)-type amino acid transporter 1 [Folsomia candida]|uniref:B(0,+)-type amino acid transporter 1 n=1 Tax=Folsomia candida TaxID=158441 RepID=A0A226E4K9_FOLCA|nr:b(0,+)-type amino acid transporter 1 [Folsomia candida]
MSSSGIELLRVGNGSAKKWGFGPSEHAYYMDTFSKMHPFFGPLPAFMFSWLTVLLLKPSSLAIISLAFGQYSLYPLLSTSNFEGCNFDKSTEYDMAKKLLAVFLAFLIAAVNIFSAKLATRVAIVFLVAKLSAMGLMIGIGIYNVSKGEWGALDLNETWDKGDASVGDIASSFYSGLWAYDGWNNLNFAMEELSNPYRNLPLAIIIGIVLVMSLYLCINLAYLTALSKTAMINSEAVAITVGDQVLGQAKWIVPVMVTLSVAGTGNGSMFSAGRISYVSGREGHMVDVMSYVHAIRLTPVVAILVNALLSIPMIFASEINDLIDLFGFVSWAIYGLALACVVILRFSKPNVDRPFRVPIIIPIIAVLTSICLVIIPIVYDPKYEYLYCLAFGTVGVVVYYVFVFKQIRPRFMDGLTKIIQKATLAAPSPYRAEEEEAPNKND